MSFTHVRGAGANNTSTVTTITITLPATPNLNDIVCVAVTLKAAVTGFSVQDSNSNVYTTTPNSPSFGATPGSTYLAYLLSAPSNATAAITATWTTAAVVNAWADEFSWTGVQPVFDQDVEITGTGTTSFTFLSITPTYSNSLIYSGCSTTSTITGPTAGGTLGVWTGATGGILGGCMAEYDLSATGATAIDYSLTGITSKQGSSMIMAFGQPTSKAAANGLPVFWMG